jgi:hypothetical protein
MYPEDRVLVGVVRRKRDLAFAQSGWYRIPVWRMPRGILADYLALFCSSSLRQGRGAIRWYAEIRGIELARRRDLIPREANHPRADEPYYRLALGALVEKVPPVRNTRRQLVTFIYTTWDRFQSATKLSDLTRVDDSFVDRSWYALDDRRLQPFSPLSNQGNETF